MKVRKTFLLFVVLLFPVIIYLFLQGFGKNQFDIPIYYETGIDTTIVGCGAINVIGQYYVPKLEDMDTAISGFKEIERGIVLYDLHGSITGGSKLAKNNALSFLNKFKDEDRISILSLYEGSIPEQKFDKNENFNLISIDSSIREYYAKCNLILDSTIPSMLVLVDEKRRVRGYFDSSQLEEIDRLNTELYILLEGSYE